MKYLLVLPQLHRAVHLRTGNIYLYFPTLKTGNTLDAANTEVIKQQMFACRRHLTSFYNPQLRAGRVTSTLGFSLSSPFHPFYKVLYGKQNISVPFQGYCPKSTCRKVIQVAPSSLMICCFFLLLLEGQIFQFMLCSVSFLKSGSKY